MAGNPFISHLYMELLNVLRNPKDQDVRVTFNLGPNWFYVVKLFKGEKDLFTLKFWNKKKGVDFQKDVQSQWSTNSPVITESEIDHYKKVALEVTKACPFIEI